MKKILLLVALAALVVAPRATYAQPYTPPPAGALVVSTCGAQTFPLTNNGKPNYQALTILQNGQLCAGSSSGGGSVTQGTSPWVDNVAQFGGSNVVTGTGASGAGIPRVTVSSDSFPATQPVSGTVTVNQGAGSVAPTTAWGVAQTGTATAAAGITPATTQSGTTLVGKASAGNLYQAYAVNTTTTAGYLVAINATAAPASGAAITPVDVGYLGGAVGTVANVSYGSGPPNTYSTGIVLLVTTSLTTYTPGGAAFIQARVR